MKSSTIGSSYTKESWKPLGAFCISPKERDDIYSKSSFTRVLDYEQQRARRNESTFSLVSCSFGENEDNKTSLRRYLSHVKKTVRAVDHIGWQGEGNVAILLPCTDRVGAEQFLNKINSFSGVARQPVSYQIETFVGDRESTKSVQEV